ncbi:MAG: hypothetical protein IJ867_07060 [Clostridia bacterium]|nr:hypothetical protein [Clostridia bacterium]
MIEMIKKHKIIVIAVLIILIVAIVLLIQKNRKKEINIPQIEAIPFAEIVAGNNKNNQNNISTRLDEGLDEIKNSLKDLFNKVETDLYSLEFYADETGTEVDFGTMRSIEFYAEDTVNEFIDYYDKNGYKIDISNVLYNENNDLPNEEKGTVQGLPVAKVGNEKIELKETLSGAKTGDYFLIRYFDNETLYTFYFISRLTNSGFKDFDLYVISSGEVYRDYGYEADTELEE